MLEELVTRLVELGRESTDLEFHSHAADPRTVYLTRGTDTLAEIDLKPPLRRWQLTGLGDVLGMLSDETVCPDPVVFVERTNVVVLCDSSDRHEWATMSLTKSDRFRALCELAAHGEGKGYRFTQSDLIRYLRFQLPGPHNEMLLPALEKVDFTRKSSGAGTVQHGKESLGRQVEAQVQQRESLPQEFTVTVPPFMNPGTVGFANDVVVGIHIDVANECFWLRPIADELLKCVDATLIQIADGVMSHPRGLVYLGAPTTAPMVNFLQNLIAQ